MAEGALGITFKVTRVVQAACMVAIIGMTSNFISQIVATEASPPSILIGTLSIAAIAILYCIITFILYLDKLLPYFIAAVIDCLFLIAVVILTVLLGKPLPYINCVTVGTYAGLNSSNVSSASTPGSSVHYGDWTQTSKSNCLESKSIWGLCIALCILFTLSATTTIFLWKRARQITAPAKAEA